MQIDGIFPIYKNNFFRHTVAAKYYLNLLKMAWWSLAAAREIAVRDKEELSRRTDRSICNGLPCPLL